MLRTPLYSERRQKSIPNFKKLQVYDFSKYLKQLQHCNLVGKEVAATKRRICGSIGFEKGGSQLSANNEKKSKNLTIDDRIEIQ